MKLASTLVTSTLLLAAAAAAACGGGGSKPASEATTASESSSPEGDVSGGDGTVVSTETMDDIRRALDRKRNAVARCLSPAVDAGELPKNARGRMTLGFTISASGKAGDLKVVKSNLESKLLTDCVFARIGEIEFPTVAEPLPWSYTYGFETM
jgi:hypothetical protein